MVMTVKERVGWDGKRTKDGHRTYHIDWLAVSTSTADGPAQAFAASGLAAVGSTWSFGNDVDAWAFCLPQMDVKPVVKKEPGYWWNIRQYFSTLPMERCQDASIENPLNEPDRISGSFTKTTKEAQFDRNGDPILTSSHERITGKAVERDYNKPTVVIEKTLATLPLSTYAPMIDTVNDATLWGLSARKIKLNNATWRRRLYGVCTYYYIVKYDFEIDYNTFDVTVLDEGTKVLVEGGTVTNPRHFKAKTDAEGNPVKVLLDGNGAEWDGTGSPGTIDIEKYPESNFLLLGIPATLA